MAQPAYQLITFPLPAPRRTLVPVPRPGVPSVFYPGGPGTSPQGPLTSVYPVAIDDFFGKTDLIDTVWANHVNVLQDAIEKLEAKVGEDASAVVTSLDYLVKVAIEPGHLHTTLSDATTRAAAFQVDAAGQLQVTDGRTLYLNPAHSLQATPTSGRVNVPRLGGTVSVNNVAAAQFAQVGASALLGLGMTPLQERLEINGGLVVGGAIGTQPGTIQFIGGRF